MAVAARFWPYLVAAGLAWAGLALGAESQKEEFLEPSLAAESADAGGEASGNLIVLTAFLVAAAVALAAAFLSRAPWRRKLRGVAGLLASVYLATVLVQSAWPNVDTCASEEGVCESLAFSINAIAANQPAIPSLLLPILAGVSAAILGAGASLRLLFGAPGRSPPGPELFLARFTAAVAFAAPFLIVAAWGNLQLLLAIPEGQAGLGIYLFVLPAAALACLAILVVACIQAWHWGAFVRNGRLAATTAEVWRGTGWALAALAGTLGAFALLGVLLPATPLAELESGRTFGVTLRGHTQFLVLLLVPMLPMLRLQRTAKEALEAYEGHTPSLEVSGLHVHVALLLAAAGASFVLAGAAAFLFEGALAAWLAALVPMAALTFRLPPAESAPTLLATAFVVWAIGNTVAGRFDAETGRLVLQTGPGALALWRLAGTVLAGIAVFRLAKGAAPAVRGRLWAASACALAMGAVLLLELPLDAWVVTRSEGQSVAIGSLLSGQDQAVRVLMHTMAAGLALAAAHAVARTWRPDWFGRRPPALPTARRAKAPA